MKRVTINFAIVLLLGLGVTLAWLWLLRSGSLVAYAQGPDGYGTYYVAPSCSGFPVPCYTTLQSAVDAADDPEDVIKVAAGTYTGVHRHTAPAGYNGPSIITQVVYISKTVTIQGGYTTAFSDPPDPQANPTTLDAQGEGRVLFISGSISPTIEGLRIIGGDADDLKGGRSREDTGGGVFLISARAIISDNYVFNNVATSGQGGGLYLRNSEAILTGNRVTTNTANSGGGLFLESSDAAVTDNNFAANVAVWSGGGLYLYNSDAILNGNTIEANLANESEGGGVLLEYSNATFSDNTVVANTANDGGGGLSLLTSDAVLSDNVIVCNTSDSGPGGGVDLHHSRATLNGNSVVSNTANTDGGGLFLWYSDDATLSGNNISSNTAAWSGGLSLQYSDARLINNLIADNRVTNHGSGLSIIASSPRLLHTTIAGNSGGDSSGIYVVGIYAGRTALLTNTILVGHKVGVYVYGATVELEGTLWGIGTWDNDTDWDGPGTILTGTHNYWGDPIFVDPDAGDYHIGSGSAAIDVGVDAGVTEDIDGDPRPAGAGYDLGADEFLATAGSEYSIYLPVVLRQSSQGAAVLCRGR